MQSLNKEVSFNNRHRLPILKETKAARENFVTLCCNIAKEKKRKRMKQHASVATVNGDEETFVSLLDEEMRFPGGTYIISFHFIY